MKIYTYKPRAVSKRTSQVEPACEGAATARYGTNKMGLVTTAAGACQLCGRGSNLLFLNLENRRKPGHALRGRIVVGACARLGFYAISRRGWLEGVKALGRAVKLMCMGSKYSIRARALATICDDGLGSLRKGWWLGLGCELWQILLLRLVLGIL